jgi:hypothetical protein
MLDIARQSFRVLWQTERPHANREILFDEEADKDLICGLKPWILW